MIGCMFAVFIIVLICGMHDYKEQKTLEGKYNVSKFPVTSKRGNQYYVEIKYKFDTCGWYDSVCIVYKRKFINEDKYKDKEVIKKHITLKEYNYNYINIASNVINTMEDIEEEIKQKREEENRLVAEARKAFAKWDGKCE